MQERLAASKNLMRRRRTLGARNLLISDVPKSALGPLAVVFVLFGGWIRQVAGRLIGITAGRGGLIRLVWMRLDSHRVSPRWLRVLA
jgi:hypothetical protein